MTAVIFGLGKAGLSSLCFLSKKYDNIYAWDDMPEARNRAKKLNIENAIICNPSDFPWDKIEFIVLSPGIPLTHPKPHYIVDMAKKHDCKIICDIEVLYDENKNAGYVGITGTNGKSTTTSLISHILEKDGLNIECGGNLGIPALDLELGGNDGAFILELSSYQLDLLDKAKMDISVLLNITPDHLERHGGMDGYINAKEKIFKNQTSDDFAVISIDDQHTRKIYTQISRDKKYPVEAIPFSCEERVYGGAAIVDGILYNDIEEESKASFEIGELQYLPGKHNAQNICASYVVSWLMGVSNEKFIEFLHSFKGLRHRMQLVRKMDDITFVNDSKATNAVSASKALASYDNIYWIAGGVAKTEGIDSLSSYFPKVKKVYLVGESKDIFAESLDGELPYTKYNNLEGATKAAYSDAKDSNLSDSIILLSPLCASFDQWKSFEERGDAFCSFVEKI